MFWAVLSLLSALVLGVYDVLKKWSLRENAVIPVLLGGTLAGALTFLPWVLASQYAPERLGVWSIPNPDALGHALLLLKAVIVGSSWLLAYLALKHLPMTIAGPIRSSGPLWTILGALLLFDEVLNAWQWLGLGTTLLFYWLFSLAGKKEGISFGSNRWVLIMVVSTWIGAISGLYDKWLVARYSPLTVQAWYALYLVPVIGLVFFGAWWPRRRRLTPFRWRWSIPLIGLSLALADFLYFQALGTEGALIALVSTLRRANVAVSFLIGAWLFREANLRRKGLLLLGLLLGIGLLVTHSH